jgi:hypothetical protein
MWSLLRRWFRRTDADLSRHLAALREPLFDLERTLVRRLAARFRYPPAPD